MLKLYTILKFLGVISLRNHISDDQLSEKIEALKCKTVLAASFVGNVAHDKSGYPINHRYNVVN